MAYNGKVKPTAAPMGAVPSKSKKLKQEDASITGSKMTVESVCINNAMKKGMDATAAKRKCRTIKKSPTG